MTRRQIRAERKAAQQRDHSWTQERDDEIDSDGTLPDEEHTSGEEFAALAREFRG